MSLPALVLTAGLGTRLAPLTRLVAKPAVPLGRRTLIEHILLWLRRQGIRDVVLNLHHRPETITAAVGDGAHLGLAIRYSWEDPILGSAGGPRHALPLIDADRFLLVNGDTLCDFDIAPMLDAHARRGAAVTLAVVPNDATDRYGGLLADWSGAVTAFVPRGATRPNWHFVGVQVAERSVFAPLGDGVPAESIRDVYQAMVRDASGRVVTWPVETTFVDVGTPRDYQQAALDRGAPEPTTVGPPVRLSRTVVWPTASLGEAVDLDDCIVAGDVHVPAGLIARSSILVPASVVLPGDIATIRDGLALFPMPS